MVDYASPPVDDAGGKGDYYNLGRFTNPAVSSPHPEWCFSGIWRRTSGQDDGCVSEEGAHDLQPPIHMPCL